MSPENDRDSQHIELPYFATCLRRVGSLKSHISEQSEWAWLEVMSLDAQSVGLLLVWNSFSLVIPAEHNKLAKQYKNVSDVALMVLREDEEEEEGRTGEEGARE